jgi:phosphoglucosamine mutase
MRKLFGTDGIRAVAGEPPLDPITIFAIGTALAHSLGAQQRVIIGMDTRESSEWIAAVLTAGLRNGGAEVENAGVITTPAIAWLARHHGFSAGIVLSASHNPWRDNGIKVFGADGYKLPDATELAIEEEIFRQHKIVTDSHAAVPNVSNLRPPAFNPQYLADYIACLRAAVPHLSLSGMRIVLDCANGAASAVAPALFAGFGGEILVQHASPNGRNINDNCGALHADVVAREVLAAHATLGITFDGDADRALFADGNGNVVNGDAVMLLAARDLQSQGRLAHSTVVATTMSNIGLEAALKRSGIKMLRAPVGDKYVLEEMRKIGANLGGEQSGHILFLDRNTTGDGLLTALLVLDIIQRSGKTLAELLSDLKVFPQVIVNVKVREKKPLEQFPAVVEKISAAEKELADCGRVVIRYSGTEPLARVMIEAESEEAMRRHANAIADAIRLELGAESV